MSKTALVVDDSLTMRNMIKLCLEDIGFNVTMGKDGVEGFNHAKETAFDIIITDINMPNMDGIELVRMLRSDNKANKFTPILVLTTEGGDNVKQAGREAGASGWIVKPFNPEILTNAVNKVCK